MDGRVDGRTAQRTDSPGTPASSRVLARTGTLVVFALAGVLLVASAVTARGTDLRAARADSLGQLVEQRAAALTRAQAEVDTLAADVADRTDRAGADATSTRERAWQRRAQALAPAAALTPVVGPGVQVVLDDAPREDRMPGNATPDDLVVHQQDVQAVVNAMWRAGASGVSVMGRRLTTTSAVRCVGNTLLLEGQVYSPPFRIEAVGDVDALLSELERDPQVQVYREYADLFGLGYDVSTVPELTLAPYGGSLPEGSGA